MNQYVSATDVRSHFDVIMQQAKESPVVVTRYGKPEVVIMSPQEYDLLTKNAKNLNVLKMSVESPGIKSPG